MKSDWIYTIFSTCHNVPEIHHVEDLSPAMLTHAAITISSAWVDSLRDNVATVIMSRTLVLIIQEEAGHEAGVNVRVGQHKSDSHLHEKLHP
jgi:hypothetical protein